MRRGLLLGALALLTGCEHGPAPSAPTALPALERAVFRVDAGTASTLNVQIPRAAFIERGGLPGVFVLDPTGRARFRLVRLGKISGDRFEVISGVRAGDLLLRGDLTQVRDGSPITTKNASNAPAPTRDSRAHKD